MPTAIEESKIQGENRTGKGQLAPQAFPSIQWDLGWSGFIFHSPPFDQYSHTITEHNTNVQNLNWPKI